MPLLHGILPAFFARLRRSTAPGDAQSRVHVYGHRSLESVGGAVLRMRALHSLRLSGRSLSEGGLRQFQNGNAQGQSKMDRQNGSEAASDARRPPRSDQVVDEKNGHPGI